MCIRDRILAFNLRQGSSRLHCRHCHTDNIAARVLQRQNLLDGRQMCIRDSLLPIPALDGGRLVFIILEMLRGKPVDPEKEGMVHMAGMAALMTLMLSVLFNDIRNLL